MSDHIRQPVAPASAIEYKGRKYRLFWGATLIEESGYANANLDRALSSPACVLFPHKDGERIDQIFVYVTATDSFEKIPVRLTEVLEKYHEAMEKAAAEHAYTQKEEGVKMKPYRRGNPEEDIEAFAKLSVIDIGYWYNSVKRTMSTAESDIYDRKLAAEQQSRYVTDAHED